MMTTLGRETGKQVRSLGYYVIPAATITAVGLALLLFRPMDDRSLERPLADFRSTIAGFAMTRDLSVPEAEVAALDAETYATLAARKRPDGRDADLAALVRSATRGSVKERVQAYLAEVARARRAK